MAKATPVHDHGNPEHGNIVIGHMIFCPACKCGHLFYNGKQRGNDTAWSFDGNVENPTFSPSMLVYESNCHPRCHSFVRNGQIQFLSDCTHELKGQTVPLEDF